MSLGTKKLGYPEDTGGPAEGGNSLFRDERGRYNGNTGVFNIISPESAPVPAEPEPAPQAELSAADEELILYSPVSETKPIEVTKLMDDPTGEIIIDDEGIKHKLNSYERWVKRRRRREENAPKRAKLLRIWGAVSPALATLVSLALTSCMECGCCSFVCPANRPLVQTNRLAKAFLKEEQAKEAKK